MCTGETRNAVRRAGAPVIVEGASSVQRYLEASILLAWAEMTWLRRVFGRETPSFLGVTHPAADRLTIGVPDVERLVPLLGRILPIDAGGVVTGIPGLRARIGRDHLDLVLRAGYPAPAMVRFLGAPRSRFTTLLREITGDQRSLVFDRDIDDREAPLFAGIGIPAAPLLSGILRRFSLWRAASEVRIGTYWERVTVTWRGDPPAPAMAAILGRSVCAVPGAVVTPVDDPSVRQIELAPGPEAPPADATEAWAVMSTVSSRGVGPSPRIIDSVVPRVLWGPPDLKRAFEQQGFRAIHRLVRRIGVSEADLAATIGQPPDADRIAGLLGFPRDWL